MAKYVIDEKTLTDIADSIRQKKGTTADITPENMPTQIASITGGGTGGGSDDVRYVTFMSYDGSIEYGKKAVAVGDDCADPIARGIFETPTRESDAQYNYNFAGWSTEPNGGLDTNALKAVTGDRTVYANFAAMVRYYTVRYFDGDVLLKTEQVVYGGTATYEPVKSGYGFVGWQPSAENITQDVDLYAQWTEVITFADSSWKTISAICESGQVEDYFAIGETKTFMVGDVPYIATIVGINCDDKADGSGKASMTILSQPEYNFNDPVKRYWGNTANEKWETCEIRTWLNGEFKENLPSSLKTAIKPVIKKTNWVDIASSTGHTLEQTENIFLPSVCEINLASELKMTFDNPETLVYEGLKTVEQRNLVLGKQPHVWLRTTRYSLRDTRVYVRSMPFISEIDSNSNPDDNPLFFTPMFCI